MSRLFRLSKSSEPPVSPVNIVDGGRARNVGFTLPSEADAKETARVTVSRTSSQSSGPSLKTPRTARFAEATTVHSPVDTRSPFSDYHRMSAAGAGQPTPSDVGFGFVADNDPSRHATYPETPLRSAMKTPGTPGRYLNPLSPTFDEENALEKREERTEATQAKDLKVKTRVRIAKMFLRGINFSCSLIVLSMLATTFSIFNATRALPARNSLPPWATDTNPWAQYVLLVISCISLVFAMAVFWGYWRGGHKRAQKAAVYYTVFAVFFFAFSIIMWGIGLGILHHSKATGNGQDLWGWACKDNTRRQLFADDVHYALVCRLQDWSLVCCIIEIVVELLTIGVYAIMFYRFYSKRRLHKSMDMRDKARSDLYLAQLRSQSAPNTPGFIGLPTPRSAAFPSPYPYAHAGSQQHDLEAGVPQTPSYQQPQFAVARDPSSAVSQPAPFQLQAPPIRIQNATPKVAQGSTFSSPYVQHAQEHHSPVSPVESEHAGLPRVSITPPPAQQAGHQETRNEHFGATAPGEQVYDSVPIPGAYEQR